MVDLVGPLTRPLGPLPVWGWAALGGGALFLFTAHRNPGSTAAAVVNPNIATPAPPGSGSGSGSGTGSGSGSGGTDTGAAPGITAKDLFGGGTLGDFLKGLGPNYESFNFASGSGSVGVQNSAQNILDEQQQEAAYAATTQQQANTYNYNLAANQQNLDYGIQAQSQNWAYSLAAYKAQQEAALAAAGHAIPAGYQMGASGTVNPPAGSYPAPVVNPGTAYSAPPSGPQCNSGNFACIRYACSRGNYGCADAAAPWVRGQESQIWG